MKNLPKRKTEKLFCYADECGQHTKGKLFVVAIAVAKEERNELRKLLEVIENETGKKATKWIKSKTETKKSYIKRVFQKHCLRENSSSQSNEIPKPIETRQ